MGRYSSPPLADWRSPCHNVKKLLTFGRKRCGLASCVDCATKRVHRFSDDGKPGRKDMHGITAFLDFNAIYSASSKKVVRAFAKLFPDAVASDREGVPNNVHAMWKRHFATITSGSCRFPDRLHAAGIIDSDICDHPECHGKRADAHHWHYQCHRSSRTHATYKH